MLELLDIPDDARWDAALEQLERARAHHHRGELQRAELLAREAIAELSAAVGTGHPDLAYARVELARLLEAGGSVDEGAAQLRLALAILEPWADEPAAQPVLLDALQAAAGNAMTRADYQPGREWLERAAELALEVAGPRSLELAYVANARGVLEKLSGHYEAARRHYRHCRELMDELGEPTPASLWHNLAGLACVSDEYELAEAHARRAIRARARELGQEPSVELGADWAGLGDAQIGQGHAREAVDSYREALRLFAAAGCDAHPEVAYALHNLADAEAELGHVDQAEALYHQAIAHKQRLFGGHNLEVAASLNNLAALYSMLGRPTEALSKSRQAIEALAGCPADHPVRLGCEQLHASLVADARVSA